MVVGGGRGSCFSGAVCVQLFQGTSAPLVSEGRRLLTRIDGLN